MLRLWFHIKQCEWCSCFHIDTHSLQFHSNFLPIQMILISLNNNKLFTFVFFYYCCILYEKSSTHAIVLCEISEPKKKKEKKKRDVCVFFSLKKLFNKNVRTFLYISSKSLWCSIPKSFTQLEYNCILLDIALSFFVI